MPAPASSRQNCVFNQSHSLSREPRCLPRVQSPLGHPMYPTAQHGLHSHTVRWSGPAQSFKGNWNTVWSCGLLPASVLHVAAFSSVHSRDMSRHEALGSAFHRRLNLPSWFPLLTVILSLKGEGPSWNQRL